MKEIKFRIWYVGEMEYPHNQEVFIGRANQKTMQYTGLKDKNGKEIYEGDIVRVLDRDWPSGNYSEESVTDYMKRISAICEVIYSEDRFELKVIQNGYFGSSLKRKNGRDIFEIIGNIYENPELEEVRNGTGNSPIGIE